MDVPFAVPGNKLPSATLVDFCIMGSKKNLIETDRCHWWSLCYRALLQLRGWSERWWCLYHSLKMASVFHRLKFLRCKGGAVVRFRYWGRKKINAYLIFSLTYAPSLSHRLVACELGTRHNVILFASDQSNNLDLSQLADDISLASSVVSGLGA